MTLALTAAQRAAFGKHPFEAVWAIELDSSAFESGVNGIAFYTTGGAQDYFVTDQIQGTGGPINPMTVNQYAGGTLVLQNASEANARSDLQGSGLTFQSTYTIISNDESRLYLADGSFGSGGTPIQSWGLRYIIFEPKQTHIIASAKLNGITNQNAECLVNVSGLQSSIDPISRKFSRSAYQLTFTDDWFLRNLLGTIPLHKASVTIKIGTKELDYSDFVVWDKTLVQDFRLEGPAIVMDTVSAWYAILSSRNYSGSFINKHPLDVVQTILDDSGVTPSIYYDAASISKDETVHEDIRHWVVSRFNYQEYLKSSQFYQDGDGNTRPWATTDNSIRNEVSAELIDSLGEILTGTFRPNINGVYQFTRFDLAAQPVYNFTDEEIADLQQVSGAGDHASHLRVVLGVEDDGSSIEFGLYSAAASAGVNNYSDNSGKSEYTVTIENKWLYPVGFAQIDTFAFQDGDPSTPESPGYISAEDAHMTVSHIGAMGFCGCAFPRHVTPNELPAYEVDPAYRLGVNNLSYIMLLDNNSSYSGDGTGKYPGGTDEIVSCDRITANDLEDYTFGYFAGSEVPLRVYGSRYTTEWFIAPSRYARFRFAGRGLFGSTPVERWAGPTMCVDVTIAVDMIQKRFPRLSYGCPEISFRLTSFEYIGLQPGDVFTLTTDHIIAYGINGSDTNIRWEAISVEPSPLEDTPGIKVVARYLSGRSGVGDDPDPAYSLPPRRIPFGGNTPPNGDPVTTSDLTIVTDSTLEIVYRS